MEDNQMFDQNSKYSMGLSLEARFAGEHIPPNGNLFSKMTIRMQILIPQINIEDFYCLSIVDSFNIINVENEKYQIYHNDRQTPTVLLIKQKKEVFMT